MEFELIEEPAGGDWDEGRDPAITPGSAARDDALWSWPQDRLVEDQAICIPEQEYG